mmetsp:Transcript_13764/g.38842  ORF Transcript_13764/g.38842 Transcript_13764/m.38842 type:complete len:802 (-) Transcript_13764:162-2567(-)
MFQLRRFLFSVVFYFCQPASNTLLARHHSVLVHHLVLRLQAFLPELDSHVGHVRLVRVVLEHLAASHPVPLQPLREAALHDAVSSDFADVRRAELVNLHRDTVLLDQGLLRHVNQERVVRGEGDVQAPLKECWEGVLRVLAEQAVVGKRGHRKTNLCQVVQVLKRRVLLQVDAVVDRIRHEECPRQVVNVSRLPGVRPEGELRHVPLLPERVQDVEVGVDIVQIVVVRRVLLHVPLFGGWHLAMHLPFVARLVVHNVESHYVVQERHQLRVLVRALRDLKEGLKNVGDELPKVVQLPALLVDGVEPGNLNHPHDVRAHELVVVPPGGQLGPLRLGFAVDAQPVLGHLVLGRRQVVKDFLGDSRQELALDVVVRLQKDLPQSGFPRWIELLVELVKPVKGGVLRVMRVHVENVDVEVVRRKPKRLEDLLQGQHLAVPHDHGLVPLLPHPLLDEAQEVLLVHAGRVVHVVVDLPHVVKVSVAQGLDREELLLRVEHLVERELLLQELQPPVRERGVRRAVHHAGEVVQVREEHLGGHRHGDAVLLVQGDVHSVLHPKVDVRVLPRRDLEGGHAHGRGLDVVARLARLLELLRVPRVIGENRVDLVQVVLPLLQHAHESLAKVLVVRGQGGLRDLGPLVGNVLARLEGGGQGPPSATEAHGGVAHGGVLHRRVRHSLEGLRGLPLQELVAQHLHRVDRRRTLPPRRAPPLSARHVPLLGGRRAVRACLPVVLVLQRKLPQIFRTRALRARAAAPALLQLVALYHRFVFRRLHFRHSSPRDHHLLRHLVPSSSSFSAASDASPSS